jgi:hypothetical protein
MSYYVIVYCGYEGIDRLFWAGSDPTKAAAEVIRLRGIAAHTAAVAEEERWTYDYHDWRAIDEPTRICVMKQQEHESRLSCCCRELGVSTHEIWWY